MTPTWDEYFISLLDPIAKRSKDPHTQVGAIIVGPDNSIRSTGYNSFPRGIKDDVAERLERPEKYLWMEHADRNAIYAAAKIGVPLEGCRMYLTIPPCMDCARAIIQAGITKIIVDIKKYRSRPSVRYEQDVYKVSTILEEAGVKLSMLT